MHSVRGTAGHVSDIAEGNALLHGQEAVAFGDAGYQGIEKRQNVKPEVDWRIAMRQGKRRALDKENEADAMLDQAAKLKASVRAKVEYPFRVIKRHFGFVKVRYGGLEEQFGSALDAICAVQFVDGARLIDGSAGMSGSENRAKAMQGHPVARKVTKNDRIAGNFSCNPIF